MLSPPQLSREPRSLPLKLSALSSLSSQLSAGWSPNACILHGQRLPLVAGTDAAVSTGVGICGLVFGFLWINAQEWAC